MNAYNDLLAWAAALQAGQTVPATEEAAAASIPAPPPVMARPAPPTPPTPKPAPGKVAAVGQNFGPMPPLDDLTSLWFAFYDNLNNPNAPKNQTRFSLTLEAWTVPPAAI